MVFPGKTRISASDQDRLGEAASWYWVAGGERGAHQNEQILRSWSIKFLLK